MILYGLDNRERIKRMLWSSSTVSDLVIIVMSVDGDTFRAEVPINRVSKRKFKQIIRRVTCMY
jgi:hypothetical protein